MKRLISSNQTVAHLCSQMADLIVPALLKRPSPPYGRNWFILVLLSLSKTFDSWGGHLRGLSELQNSNLRVSLLHSAEVSTIAALFPHPIVSCLVFLSDSGMRRRQLLKVFGTLSSLLPIGSRQCCFLFISRFKCVEKKGCFLSPIHNKANYALINQIKELFFHAISDFFFLLDSIFDLGMKTLWENSVDSDIENCFRFYRIDGKREIMGYYYHFFLIMRILCDFGGSHIIVMNGPI